MMRATTRNCLFLTASVLLVAAVASAGTISDPMFTIEALAAGEAGSFEVPVSAGTPDGDTVLWTLPEPVLLIDANGDGQIDPDTDTFIETANLAYVADPIVTLNFAVSSGAPTFFTVTSASLGFPSISNAIGRATAAVTVTDFNGNGASLTGLHPLGGGRAFQAFYNDSPGIPATGTSFAQIVGSISSSTPFSSVTGSESFPLVAGFSSTDQAGTTMGTVSSMSTQFRFRVSSGDSASGTSSFVIIPEPNCLLLLVLGITVLIVGRRRRR